MRVELAPGVEAEIVAVHENGERTVRFDGTTDVLALADRVGSTPLPPYIDRAADARDRDDYQTVYAAAPGAVAAPTAGLHFTPGLLDRVRARGVDVASVTLHVGPGTFRPVQGDDLDAHRMHAEAYEIPDATAAAVARAHAAGRRVVAVGHDRRPGPRGRRRGARASSAAGPARPTSSFARATRSAPCRGS